MPQTHLCMRCVYELYFVLQTDSVRTSGPSCTCCQLVTCVCYSFFSETSETFMLEVFIAGANDKATGRDDGALLSLHAQHGALHT